MQEPPGNEWERDIGRRLREIREVTGMTEAELAARIGQKPAVIEAIESGSRRVTASELWDLCSVLNSKPHEFFENGDQ